MKIGIVGATSLMGKELADELGMSALAVAEVVLLDEEETAGQLTAMGDEPSFIQRIEASSFAGMDLVFFAGSAEQTARHWAAAKKTGASAVDLSGGLKGESGVVVRSPWVAEAQGKTALLDLGTFGVIPADPVATMLGLIAARCVGLGLDAMVATVLEPASQRGQAGMDEMHQQTVNLLSFQPLVKNEYDAQVAFNLLPGLGAAAKVPMGAVAERVREHYRAMGDLPALEMQMVHAPVFHGYGISVLLEGSHAMKTNEVARAIEGVHVDLRSDDTDGTSNVDAAGQSEILVQMNGGTGKNIWLWMAADNLKLAALQAIDCAVELLGMRPQGVVQ